MTRTLQGLPAITVERWPGRVFREDDLAEAVAFLALKTGKPVRVREHRGSIQYSSQVVNVEFRTEAHNLDPVPVETVAFSGNSFSCEDLTRFRVDADGAAEVTDESGMPVAHVFHNNVVFTVNFAGSGDEVSRLAIPFFLEKALPFLDFEVEALVEEEHQAKERVFREAYLRAARERVRERELELSDLERASARAYETIMTSESRRRVVAAELSGLKSFEEKPPEDEIRRQVTSLSELEASGQYRKVTFRENGTVEAETSPVEIEYNDYVFPLGAYSILISPKGLITIDAIDGRYRASHPHPHVGTDGVPCLGNISADIAKMLGRMQVAETLQLLKEFLSSYNPDNPYENISHFDPYDEYVDPDEDPCQGCDDSCTPHCITSCRHNDSIFTCSDCTEMRTDYCYGECALNEQFEVFCPCDYCNHEHCIHDECPDYARAVELGIQQAPANEDEAAEPVESSQNS